MPLTSQPLGLSRHQPSSPALVLLQEASLGLYPAPVWMGCPACVHSPGPYNSGSPRPSASLSTAWVGRQPPGPLH